MEKPVVVYCPFPDAEAAMSVGTSLVEERLVACVNILPPMTSVYRWQGRVETAEEVVALFKTRESLKDRVGTAIRQAHPYDTPTIIYLATEGAEATTLAWLLEETKG